MIKRFFSLGLMILLALGAWADDPVAIKKTTLWTFGSLATGSFNDTPHAIDGLYASGHTSESYASIAEGNVTISISDSDKPTDTDELAIFKAYFPTSATKYLSLNNGNTNHITKSIIANEHVNDRVSFYASVPGTLYVFGNVTTANKKFRFYAVEGSTNYNESEYTFSNTDPILMKCNISSATSVFMGSGNSSSSACLYAILFIPTEKVETPTIDYANGQVTISGGTSSTNANTTLYYTIDGSVPTTESYQYTGSFAADAETTIKAISISANGPESFVAEKTLEAVPTVTTISERTSWTLSGVDNNTALNSTNLVNWNNSGLFLRSNNADASHSVTAKTTSGASGTFSNGTEWSATMAFRCPASELAPSTNAANAETVESKNDRCLAFNVSVAGTVYVAMKTDGSTADRELQLFFNGTKVDSYTTTSTAEWVELRYSNTGAGAYYIGGTIANMIGYILFVPNEMWYKVTIGPDAEDTGTVSITSPTSVPVDNMFLSGTSITVTATPKEGYAFVNWINSNEEVVSTSAEYTITSLSANQTLTANFAPLYTLTTSANPAAGGTIASSLTSGSKDGEKYLSGAVVSLTAKPNSGYEFWKWSTGDTDNPLSVTVDDNKNITGYFHHPISEAKTWTFNDWENNTYKDITSKDSELYLRAFTTESYNMVIGDETTYKSHTFTGQSTTTISKSLTLGKLNNGTVGTYKPFESNSYMQGTLSFETSVPGVVYVVMSNSTEGTKYRINYYDGNNFTTGSDKALATVATEYSQAVPAGTVYIAGKHAGTKVYAVRFVPESVSAPTIRNNNGTITITPGASSVGATVMTYYTTDGSNPTSSSSKYTETFVYPAECTQIKAITISESSASTESETTSKIVPTIPTALSANSISFVGLETSAVTVDDGENFTINTETKKYSTKSASASALYINDVSFCYSTVNRDITLGNNYTLFEGSGLTITIPGLTAGQIVVLSSSSNNSSAVTFSCSSGGTILSGSTTSIQTTPTNLVIQSTGGNLILTTAGAGLRLYRITLANTLSVAVANEQSEWGTAVVTTPTVPETATVNDAALGDGYYVKGSSITVKATPEEDYYFVEWKNGDTQASTLAEYSFKLSENVALTAYFAAKTGSSITTGPSANSLTYTGAAQQLINTTGMEYAGGTMMYCLTENGEYTADAATITGTDAGTYTVYYKVVGDKTHSDTDISSVEVTIAKATLTLDGTLTATATYGTKLNEISNFTGIVKIANTENVVAGTWAISGDDILDVGTYTGTYTAVFTPTQAEDKDNYYALEEQNVSSLTITAAAATVTTAPSGATGLTYNGSAQQIINATSAACVGGVLWYCKTQDGEYTTEASTITETNAGTYSFYYKVVADGNHTGIDPVEVTGIEIAQYNISDAEADAAIADQAFTGSQITPDAPAIKMGETTIDATNYEVTYGENISAGSNTGSIIYTATNQNFTGTKTLYFNIIGADLTFNGSLSATAAYGTSVKNITITPEGNVTFGETVIAGTWSFSDSDNDVLQVGNTTAKTATFHPTENAGNYNALTREVTPTITAVALTITAKDQSISEGESISQDVSQVDVTGLVNGDQLTGITLAASTTAVTTEGTITPSNAVISPSTDNYTISYQTGNLTIKQIPTYTITDVAEDANGNSVTADATSAREGATITLTITTADTYTLTSISATGATLSGTGNTRTFTMPAANVTISAAFTLTSTIDETKQITENVNKTDGSHAEVTSVEIGASTTSVTISSTVDGVPVTSIADNAFSNVAEKGDIKSIDLSATSITGVAVSRSSGVFSGFPEETMIYMPTGNTADGQKNVVIGGTCADFEMVNEKSYNIPTSFTATNATLIRSFASDVYCTLCLPYAIPAGNLGGKIYEFTSIEGTTVQMTEDADGLDANKPYIFVPSATAEKITASTVEVNMSSTPNTENTSSNFTFKGVFEHKDFTAGEISGGVYGFAADTEHGASSVGQFVKAANGAWIEGMRAYLAYSGSELTGTASTRGEGLPDMLNVVLIHANGSTTNIGRLELMTAEDGSPVYNLNGQRVDSSYKGLVIKNGKKVVKK